MKNSELLDKVLSTPELLNKTYTVVVYRGHNINLMFRRSGERKSFIKIFRANLTSLWGELVRKVTEEGNCREVRRRGYSRVIHAWLRYRNYEYTHEMKLDEILKCLNLDVKCINKSSNFRTLMLDVLR